MSSRKRKQVCALVLKACLDEIDEEVNVLTKKYCSVRSKTSDVYNFREDEGVFQLLIHKHLLDDEIQFQAYFRFTRNQFYYLLEMVEELLTCEPCNRVKRPISPAEKLALTLRFLATGESMRSLAFAYRISPSSISKFIPQVLHALKIKLVPKHLPPPDIIKWEKIAEEFWSRWSFPNLLGALDGKHVRIVAPDNTGSLFFNYKNYFSTVLLALVDAHCKYIIVDVGSYGKEGDAGIFNKSQMGKLIQSGSAFPEPQYLPNSNILLPHVVVADDAFRLDKHLVKGYCKKQALEDGHKRNFNYHVSRVRRVSENAFGIMCAVFRIFFTPINVLPQTVDLIVIVCCALHNFLRDEFISNNPNYKEGLNIHDLPVENMIPLAGKGGFAKSEGFKVRYQFTEYFKNKSARKTT